MTKTHLVLRQLWHSKEKKYYVPMQKVSLAHLDENGCRILEKKGSVLPLKGGATELQDLPGLGEKKEEALLAQEIYSLELLNSQEADWIAHKSDGVLKEEEILAWQLGEAIVTNEEE